MSENRVLPDIPRIKVFPNPFNSTCTIFSKPNSFIRILDITGKEVLSDKTNYCGRFTWKPKNMPSGLYLVKSQYSVGKIVFQK
ncbi:T9SS type A sorting domain-containing protein [bacterium]|nr:T9SS type A sorting domain-containing protein [bacterium]